MYALIWLIPVTLLLAGGGLLLFLWCARSGQFEDLDGAAWRILRDDDVCTTKRRDALRPPSGRQSGDRQG